MVKHECPKDLPGFHWEEVFCRCIRRNGKVIYPKNSRFFHFWVKVKN